MHLDLYRSGFGSRFALEYRSTSAPSLLAYQKHLVPIGQIGMAAASQIARVRELAHDGEGAKFVAHMRAPLHRHHHPVPN